MVVRMHLYNQTSLFSHITLHLNCVHRAVPNTNCLDVTSLLKGWQAATGPHVWLHTPVIAHPALQRYYSSRISCICMEPRRGHRLCSLGRGDHCVLPQQQSWWCEDTQMYIKAMLREVTPGALLEAAASKGALAQWFKNKPLERSRILATLQVPFPSTSEHQMDFFQQSHRFCVMQTKGTEESVVLNQGSSQSELPFPIPESKPEPAEQKALSSLHAHMQSGSV